LFPAKCLACGSFLYSRGISFNSAHGPHIPLPTHAAKRAILLRGLMSAFLCSACLPGAITVTSPICTTCGVPFKSRSGDNHVCGRCIRGSFKFRMARASAIYQKGFMKLVHCFKYMGKTQLARPFSLILLNTFLRFWRKEKIDFIVPVPLHAKRFRKRGFNQAYLMIREWPALAAAMNLEMPCSRIERRLLFRKRHTPTQTGLGRQKRRKNIKDAFQITHGHDIKDKRVLLVDDVLTTGATADECAAVMLKNGALSVDVLTLARAPAV